MFERLELREPGRRAAILLSALSFLTVLPSCAPNKEPKQRYLTESVQLADIEKSVSSSGVLQPLEAVTVGAQASGQIQSLRVELGDFVRKGQELAIIDPATQSNTLRNAEAALAAQKGAEGALRATLVRDELNLGRQKQLLAQGYASQAAFDQARATADITRANLRTTAAQIRQADLAVEQAQVDLNRTRIVAPIDGVVASILVREGQTVNSALSTPPLLRLAKVDVMTVKVLISEADIIGVRPGQKVYFSVLGDPGTRYVGVLRTIEPVPDKADDTLVAPENTAVYYNALFDTPNPSGRLRSSMTAQVNIVLATAKNTKSVASGVLGRLGGDGRYLVRVIDPKGALSERWVKIGINNGARVQILDGLALGESVVVGDAEDKSVQARPKKDR
jgi:macrolide-specific efflux system membrane fusion protein